MSCLAHVLNMIYIITIFRTSYIPHAQIFRNFISNVPHVHNIASQTMGEVYFETF